MNWRPGTWRAFDAKCGKFLARNEVNAALTAAVVLCGIAVGWWFAPEPQSDWAYYWAAAGDLSRYERGGVGLWLLGGVKAIGWSPAVSALVLNVPAVLCMAWLMRRIDGKSVRRFLGVLVLGYLLLLSPYLSIVQLDLIAAAFMALGFFFVAAPPRGWPKACSLGLAFVCVASAVSTKPQYALIAWVFAGLLCLLWWSMGEGIEFCLS